MAASFQAKDSAVLQAQLKVQELCVFASDGLVSISGGDLVVSLNESIVSVNMGMKQVAAGTLSGLLPSIQNDSNGKPTQLLLAGQGSQPASTCFLIKYVTAE